MSDTTQELRWLDHATRFLDNRFRIPGTDIRFGLDFLLGIIPGVGDIVSLSLSGLLVTVMARKGASGMVIVKMIVNIVLDALVGTIPVLGDIFDLTYRANRRNLHLLQTHYETGEHEGSAWPVVIAILVLLVLIIAATIYMAWWVLNASWELLAG